jgi:hypothetical protein
MQGLLSMPTNHPDTIQGAKFGEPVSREWVSREEIAASS